LTFNPPPSLAAVEEEEEEEEKPEKVVQVASLQVSGPRVIS